jgi:hypothetical protein
MKVALIFLQGLFPHSTMFHIYLSLALRCVMPTSQHVITISAGTLPLTWHSAAISINN